MSEAAAGGLPARPRLTLRGAAWAAALSGAGLATVAFAWWSNGNVGAAAVPVLLIAAAWVACSVPLRWTATVLVFLLLAIDDLNNAMGVWHTPWAVVNELLISNIDRVVPAARGAKLSGMELILLLLLGVSIYRRARGVRIDTRDQVQTATLIAQLVVVYVLAILYATVHGLLRTGGSVEVAIWQARPMLHLAFLFFLFHAAFRGSRDHLLLGRLVVASAVLKAMLAVWVRATVTIPGRELNAATNHGDSILFAVACIILLARFVERTDRRRLIACLLLIPPILLGIHANTRRLAWVQLSVAAGSLYLLSPWRPWKRSVTRAAIMMAPVMALYLAVGWDSSAEVFGPIRTLRSVTESSRDRSTFFRHVENWNLVVNMDDRPVLGRGFGHTFVEFYRNDEISSFFPQYLAEPHNQLLALLLFGGLVGFVGFFLLFAAGTFLAVRSYRMATTPEDRAAALACFATIVICHIQTYGDLGPYLIQYKVLMAMALVVAGKLAVTTGAWPARVLRAPGAS